MSHEYAGRPRLLSNLDLGVGRSMLASGFTIAQIAARFRVCTNTAYRRLKWGEAYRQPERRW